MSLTPRMFAALRKRRSAEHERQELLNGILAANVANYSMWKMKQPATPADFMPSRIGREGVDDLVAIHNTIVNPTTLREGTTRIG